jgi:hypothetical protein
MFARVAIVVVATADAAVAEMVVACGVVKFGPLAGDGAGAGIGAVGGRL